MIRPIATDARSEGWRATEPIEQLEGREKALRSATLESKLAHHLLPAVAALADELIVRQEDVFENDLVEMMRAGHIDDWAYRYARCCQVEQKLTRAIMPRLTSAIGAAEEDHIVRAMRVRGPQFRAIDAKSAILLYRAGAHSS